MHPPILPLLVLRAGSAGYQQTLVELFRRLMYCVHNSDT